ncbi:hypothetical protein, partial [Streptomyces sp. DvalAA-19]|uniref:hypothetical protein n=1 Tax=Streptomyces sp. DvalAA-19 TaxID=1839761 RepID=UPI001960E04E
VVFPPRMGAVSLEEYGVHAWTCRHIRPESFALSASSLIHSLAIPMISGLRCGDQFDRQACRRGSVGRFSFHRTAHAPEFFV